MDSFKLPHQPQIYIMPVLRRSCSNPMHVRKTLGNSSAFLKRSAIWPTDWSWKTKRKKLCLTGSLQQWWLIVSVWSPSPPSPSSPQWQCFYQHRISLLNNTTRQKTLPLRRHEFWHQWKPTAQIGLKDSEKCD